MRLFTRSTLICILLFGCVGCDQATKGIARTYLMPGAIHSYLHDVFRIVLAANPGAFLSLGANLPEAMRTAIFIGGVGILTLGSLSTALLARRLNHLQICALTLIGSGGLGNLLDRLTHGGQVTDFLNVGLGTLRTGIFNVADIALMVGLGLLCFFFSGSRTPVTDSAR